MTIDLKAFATEVKTIAQATPAEGVTRKAWIHHVYGAFLGRLDYDAFKALLWKAANAGLVELTRCDMVEAFAPSLVRRSLMSVNGGTFNWVRF